MDKLSNEQNEMLIGGLLGDLSLENLGLNARFKIERSIKDLKYLEWQFDLFKNFCKNIHFYNRYDKRYNKYYQSIYLRSRACPVLTKYYEKWYDKKKRIPHDIKLTPLVLAVWFADDGCITKYSENNFNIKFSTECFLPEDVDYLTSLLLKTTGEKFNKYKKRPGKDQYIIKSSSRAAESLMNIIQPYLIKINMERKIKNISNLKSVKSYYDVFKFLKDNPWSYRKDIKKAFTGQTGSILCAASEIGLIEAKVDEKDKRKYLYRLTFEGEQGLRNRDIRLFKRKR